MNTSHSEAEIFTYKFDRGEKDALVSEDLRSGFNKVMLAFQKREKKLQERLLNLSKSISALNSFDEAITVKPQTSSKGMYFLLGFVIGALFTSVSVTILIKKVRQAVHLEVEKAHPH